MPVSKEVVILVEGLQDSPIATDQVRAWTQRDPLLSKVLSYTQKEWPKGAELKPYWNLVSGGWLLNVGITSI